MEAVRERTKSDALPVEPRKQEIVNKLIRLADYLLIVACLLGSIYLLDYKPIHDGLHTLRMNRLITQYEQAVAALTEDERGEILESARAYNSRLNFGAHFQPTEEELNAYTAQLDFTGTGMMGYIQIPKLNVKLPIYHTTDEEVLAEAVGHIPGSSLPVGGQPCHTALCAHRDLSTATLFHDLDKLEMGDTFTLTVLDETVTYAVDQVTVVRPQDVEDLAIEPGQDYCTLVTCHPHGSSEFRMLVRGRRVA